ncbi:hypothetical protein IHE45_10G081000 [Dioscorea alata]|uniref:Uncharacterized protein n=1 Tax=Dioscorea alata TaxID=55571 RepID=A0ACB7VCA0_DIOAL|nr:hypothetical protein IHE45_10G081000 [Dioscorea alata]
MSSVPPAPPSPSTQTHGELSTFLALPTSSHPSIKLLNGAM